jgi:hypothetical protein
LKYISRRTYKIATDCTEAPTYENDFAARGVVLCAEANNALEATRAVLRRRVLERAATMLKRVVCDYSELSEVPVKLSR